MGNIWSEDSNSSPVFQNSDLKNITHDALIERSLKLGNENVLLKEALCETNAQLNSCCSEITALDDRLKISNENLSEKTTECLKNKREISEQNKKINQLICKNSAYAKQIKNMQNRLSQQNESEQAVLRSKNQKNGQNKKINQLVDENEIKEELARNKEKVLRRFLIYKRVVSNIEQSQNFLRACSHSLTIKCVKKHEMTSFLFILRKVTPSIK